MIKFKEMLDSANYEVEMMLRHCDKKNRFMRAHLESTQWNIRRLKSIIDLKDRFVSRVQKRTK